MKDGTRWRSAPRALLALAVTVLMTATVAAQSNERIDELLAQDPATLGHTSYVILSAAGIVSETVSPQQALDAARTSGLVAADATAETPATFGDAAYLLMRSFGISGGVMYRIIPGPRYAAREVVFQGWSRTRRAPGDAVSGEAVLRILSVYLNEAAEERGGE